MRHRSFKGLFLSWSHENLRHVIPERSLLISLANERAESKDHYDLHAVAGSAKACFSETPRPKR